MKRLFWAVIGILMLTPIVATNSVSAAQLRDDGLHYQPWIKVSFLDLADDLAEALEKGKKGLVIIYEQNGCGACKRLHEVNFADKDLVAYINQHFDVVQINLYGDNEVTDFDGEILSESAFAEKHVANFTPTTAFHVADGEEVFRLPGYMPARFYRQGYEYVVDDGHNSGLSYPRWVQARRKAAKPSN